MPRILLTTPRAWTSPVPNRALNSYLATFEPVEAEHTRLHEHPGIELLYVLSGRLELSAREDKHELAEGDAIYFDATVPHGYRRIGTKRTTALVVTLGPREQELRPEASVLQRR